MRLSDVFEYLSYGELSQLAQGHTFEQLIGPQADILRAKRWSWEHQQQNPDMPHSADPNADIDDIEDSDYPHKSKQVIKKDLRSKIASIPYADCNHEFSDKELSEYANLAHNVQKILTHVNLGLKELYKRFFLQSKQLTFQQYEHIETYTLDRRFAMTNIDSDEPIRYITDSVWEPFCDDVLKIEQVFDEDGRELFLNDRSQAWSVYTPAYNQVQIPYPMWCNILSVHYRASHPTVVFHPGDDPRQVQLNIPEALLEPLLFYVAGRAFGTLATDEGNQGNIYMQKYEASCMRAEKLGLQVTPMYGNHRLDLNGWV